MSAEGFLSSKLRKFSLFDFGFVKSVYFIVGLLAYSLYSALSSIDWWFYLILAILCGLPLYIHLFSQKGNLLQKAHAYLQTNNPSNQVLLFLSLFFFALMVGTLIPILVSGSWWIYVLVIAVLAIKPLTKTWFW
ncbi:MAG: hypothetical protein ABI597_13830 [Gammaproteobacteria bacterium]